MAKHTTVATLTDQLETTADLDENGLEPTPFDGFETPTNGHVPEGIRPSERCPAVSVMGPLIGSSCTKRQEHAGYHSWQPADNQQNEPESTSTASRSSDSSSAEQPTLPGTPEPVATAYDIPYESVFQNADYRNARGVAEIGDRFIETIEEFAHLRGIEVRYLWKRRGGLKGGNPRLGALQKPGGLTAYALGNPTFILWLAADHCRKAELTNVQIDALIFDLLCRGVADPDDHSAFRVASADYEGNVLTLDRFGFWHPDLREMAAHIRQLGLLDTLPPEAAIEQAADDAAAEGDDSEDQDE